MFPATDISGKFVLVAALMLLLLRSGAFILVLHDSNFLGAVGPALRLIGSGSGSGPQKGNAGLGD